jgi:hypothetical protein
MAAPARMPRRTRTIHMSKKLLGIAAAFAVTALGATAANATCYSGCTPTSGGATNVYYGKVHVNQNGNKAGGSQYFNGGANVGATYGGATGTNAYYGKVHVNQNGNKAGGSQHFNGGANVGAHPGPHPGNSHYGHKQGNSAGGGHYYNKGASYHGKKH